jgi:hypothetical protein
LAGLLGAGLVLLSAPAEARKKKGAVTDPMEAESNPQGPAAKSEPTVDTTTAPPASSGTGGGGGSSGGGGSGGGSSGGGGGATVQTEKVGRFMFNLKLGPALCAFYSVPKLGVSGSCNNAHMGAIVLDFGWSVLPNKNAYLLLPLQFQFRDSIGVITVPVGFQYDVQLPVKGLYVYPRVSLGYSAIIASQLNGQTVTSHFGVLTPEFGVKYVFGGRWNVGGELFSLPIYFNGDGSQIYYRILLYGGVNF